MFALGAGSDTTGSTIRGTMLQLITNPRVYLKLKETVAQAVSQGLVSSPIKQEEAKKLSYLQVRIAHLLPTSAVEQRCATNQPDSAI